MKLEKLIKNKRGSALDILILLVMSFIIVMFFGLWIYGFNQVSDNLQNIDTGDDNINISDAARLTFGRVDSAQTTGLHVLAFVMIFAMALSILISNFLVKAHPVFFVVYIFVTIVAIIGAAYISNYYEEILVNDVIGATFQEFTASNFIMLYLPLWIAVIGIFGGIFLFAGILRDSGGGGSVV